MVRVPPWSREAVTGETRSRFDTNNKATLRVRGESSSRRGVPAASVRVGNVKVLEAAASLRPLGTRGSEGLRREEAVQARVQAGRQQLCSQQNRRLLL